MMIRDETGQQLLLHAKVSNLRYLELVVHPPQLREQIKHHQVFRMLLRKQLQPRLLRSASCFNLVLNSNLSGELANSSLQH